MFKFRIGQLVYDGFGNPVGFDEDGRVWVSDHDSCRFVCLESCFEDWMRRFFMFVVPLAFVSYFPALHLLERPDPLGLPTWLQLASPAVAVVFLLVAGVAWRFGVAHYQSTGS